MSTLRLVCDTGPILHLDEAQLLHLLGDVGEIHAPERVVVEIRRIDPSWKKPAWLEIDALAQPYVTDAAAWQAAGLLHPGEAETIALARQISADWLLTDDAAARLFASELGFEVHGSLGILLWSAATGKVSPADSYLGLERLAASSLWMSARVLNEAQRALDEIFDA